MSRLPQKEWWARYQFRNEYGVFDTGRVVYAGSLVEARKVAYEDAMEEEILLDVEPIK